MTANEQQFLSFSTGCFHDALDLASLIESCLQKDTLGKKVQTGFKEKAFPHKDHQISEQIVLSSHATGHPWRIS